MGITFKENVSDIRNSKIADLIKELMSFSVNVHIVDPNASPNEVVHEYGLTLMDEPSNDYDAVIVSVQWSAPSMLPCCRGTLDPLPADP